MSLTVTIIGRPNVGKSTLFNRLAKKKLALVDDQPGVTRDRREGQGKLGKLRFTIIDTAGLEKAETASLEEHMMVQTQVAIEMADILLFVIDARQGLLPIDSHFADMARKSGKETLMIANKAEGNRYDPSVFEALKLGLGDPLMISAEHGQQMDELEEAIAKKCEKMGIVAEEIVDNGDENSPIQIAIAGRPNVGKSTLLNELVQDERSIVSPIAGTTRDSVTIDWEYDGKAIKLIDTAGLRKKSQRNKERVEKLSVDDSFRAIQFANVVVLLIDATAPLEKVELQIAKHVLDEGRAMVLALNKWDLVKEKKETLEEIRHAIGYDIAQAKGLPVITMSALKGIGKNALMKAVLGIYETWNKRISTGQLNKWLEGATSEHLPPLSRGQRIRLKYATQIKTRPPTFAIFTSSRVKDLPDSYVRYLTNDLRESFGLDGVPMRVLLRKTNNPYDKEK